jgi:hypothetical protein
MKYSKRNPCNQSMWSLRFISKNDHTKIYTRRATSTDRQRIIAILTTAFWREDAVGVYIHTEKEKYPEDVEKFWRRKLRYEWPICDIEVAVLVDGENAGKVVGVAIWAMKGGPKLSTCKSLLPTSSKFRILWTKNKPLVLIRQIEMSY